MVSTARIYQRALSQVEYAIWKVRLWRDKLTTAQGINVAQALSASDDVEWYDVSADRLRELESQYGLTSLLGMGTSQEALQSGINYLVGIGPTVMYYMPYGTKQGVDQALYVARVAGIELPREVSHDIDIKTSDPWNLLHWVDVARQEVLGGEQLTVPDAGGGAPIPVGSVKKYRDEAKEEVKEGLAPFVEPFIDPLSWLKKNKWYILGGLAAYLAWTTWLASR